MRHLNLLVLRCGDIERCRAFYELLGLRFVKHAHGSGPEHYAHEDERGVFELYPAGETAPPDSTGLGFTAADLEPVRQALESHGHAPGGIKETEWGVGFVVRDPDRRRVEVKRRAAPT